MSEAEKRRRLEYKRIRKKWMLVQAILLLIVTATVLSLAFAYFTVSKTKTLRYTEDCDINYLVKLTPNDFYEEELIDGDRAYVTDLVDTIVAGFDYDLNMSAFADVVFSYSYNIDATLLIKDKYTEAVVYDEVTELVPRMYYTQNGADTLSVEETAFINFKEYNDKAKDFIETYDLKNAAAELVLTMNMDVASTSAEFEGKSRNTYFVTATFPLATELSEPVTTSSVADGDVRTLACKTEDAKALLVLSIVFGSLDLLLAGFFLFFTLKTRNHDINYTNKVKRLVASYRSFIQEITTPFATEGYQLVYIKTFNEMLEVRDTIGSPLLMYANEDGTATSFVIPTNTGLLYIFEIRVEDYDDIYGISDANGEITEAADGKKLDLCETMEATWQTVKAFICRVCKQIGAFFCRVGRAIKEFFRTLPARFKKKPAKAKAPAKKNEKTKKGDKKKSEESSSVEK